VTAHLELEDLSALLDGELERRRAEEARRHLEGCAECSERYAAMQRSVATLRGLAAAPPPPEILHRIRRQAAAIPANPSLLERVGDWLHPPALRPAFAAAFSLVFAAVLAVYGLNAYYGRQAPSGTASDQPLEAFLRSGVPPGPSGQRAASGGEAKEGLTEKDKQDLRALGYVSGPQAQEKAPGASASASKKTAAVAAPARQPASAPAPATRLAQPLEAPPSAGTDKPALNTSRDAAEGRPTAADAEAAGRASAEVGGLAPAPGQPKAPEPELQKARSEETAPEARERAKAATAPAPPSPSPAMAPPAEQFARQDAPERQIAGRAFTRSDGAWLERGIRPEAARSRIAVDSAAGRELLARLPDLRLLLRDAGVVVLRDGGRVVELRATKLPPP
jgi:hypothetical protein